MLVAWGFILTNVHKWNHPWIPETRPSWSPCVISSRCWWILFASVLLRTFAWLFVRDVCLWFSAWLCYQGNVSLIEWIGEGSPLFNFFFKAYSKLGIIGKPVNLIKDICEKLIANTILNCQRLRASLQRRGKRYRCPSHCPYSTPYWSPACATSKKKYKSCTLEIKIYSGLYSQRMSVST